MLGGCGEGWVVVGGVVVGGEECVCSAEGIVGCNITVIVVGIVVD